MQSVQHYCAILGVNFDAPPEQIRAAYLALVKVWHPDRFTDSPQLQQKAEAEIKKINQAYEALKSWSWGKTTVGSPTANSPPCSSESDRRWSTILKTYSKPQVCSRTVSPDLYQKFGR
ncbi:MAG: J domain-containing protein [Cyanophyceae cyanobacterium]